MEAAAPSASSPRVPGSGVEVPGPWWGPVGAEHQLGIALQVAPPECATGAPIAIEAQAKIPNMTFRMASSHVLRVAMLSMQSPCHVR